MDLDLKQWKEKGVGEIKVLLNGTTNKHSVVMRRDQVCTVCCVLCVVYCVLCIVGYRRGGNQCESDSFRIQIVLLFD